MSLDLSQTDAEIYVYLAATGPTTARNIIKTLSINKRQIYRRLKLLEHKGIILSKGKYPSQFSALSFEQVIDMLIEIKEAQAKILHTSKKEFISDFRNKNKKHDTPNN